jgi:hypothetical protein
MQRAGITHVITEAVGVELALEGRLGRAVGLEFLHQGLQGQDGAG